MNIVELLELQPDTWLPSRVSTNSGLRKRPASRSTYRPSCRLHVELRDKEKLGQQLNTFASSNGFIINGDDYFQRFVSDRITIRPYGWENLEFVDEVLKDVSCMDNCGFQSTFLFERWLEKPIDEAVRMKQNISELLNSIGRIQTESTLVDLLHDPNVFNLCHLKNLYIQLLLALNVPVVFCDADINKNLVALSTHNHCSFMATSVDCGVLLKQIPSALSFFLRTTVFSSNCIDVNDTPRLACEVFNMHSKCLQWIEPKSLPIITFLSCSLGIPLPNDLNRSHLGDEDGHLNSQIKRFAELLRCSERFTLTEADRKFLISRLKIISTNEWNSFPGSQMTSKCHSRFWEGAMVNDIEPYQYDWPTMLMLSYQEEDPIQVVTYLWDGKLAFLQSMLRTIENEMNLVGRQYESVNRLCHAQLRLVTAWINETKHGDDVFGIGGKIGSDQISTADTSTKLTTRFKSDREAFLAHFTQYTRLKLDNSPVTLEAQFTACFIALWLESGDHTRSTLTPMALAVVASSLTTLSYVKGFLSNSDELQPRISNLVQHHIHVSALIENNCASFTHTVCAKTVRRFARTVQELEDFVLQFCRLIGLIDLACLYFHRSHGYAKPKWPSSNYLIRQALWILFPSSRLLYALFLLLDETTPETRQDVLQDVWIPRMLPKDHVDDAGSCEAELLNVQAQFRWVCKFVIESSSQEANTSRNISD